MDDIWDTKAWDCMKMLFPNDNNGSRIIVTTRVMDVAININPGNKPHCMNFLGTGDSMRLLCNKVFGKDTCPPELEKTAKEISDKCRGLPLAVILVAGHLSKISKTKDSWSSVAATVNSIITTSEKQFMDIFALSFSLLPQYLKACFLYLATFPKNFEIPAWNLIRLWIAVGLIHEECPKSMEELAFECLEDLISRGLIIVRKRKADGRVKTFDIHDLLWDLCLDEAQKVSQGDYGVYPHLLHRSCFYIVTNANYHLCRCIISFSYFGTDFDSNFHFSAIGFKRLRVFNCVRQTFPCFPDAIARLFNLRYLAFATCGSIPRSVSQLQNLETLINCHKNAGGILPKEMWEMPKLRHLHVGTCSFFPDPASASADGNDAFTSLPNLQTLTISSVNCTKEVFSCIPNLKDLEVHESGDDCSPNEQLNNCLNNVVHLNQLENLKFCCSEELEKPRCMPEWITIPPNIRQLTIAGSSLPWEGVSTLAMLPNLEVLKLKRDAFRGPVWELNYEGFPQLNYLLLESLNLEQWTASCYHFPELECLDLRYCKSLENIPYGFWEIHTLQKIELVYCR